MLVVAQGRSHKSDVHWEILRPEVTHAIGKFGKVPMDACDVYHGRNLVVVNRPFYIYCHSVAHAQRKRLWFFRFVLLESDGKPTHAEVSAQSGSCIYHCEPLTVVPKGESPPDDRKKREFVDPATAYEMYKLLVTVDPWLDKLFLSNMHLLAETTIIYNQSLLKEKSDQEEELLRIYQQRVPTSVDPDMFCHVFGFKEPYTATHVGWFAVPAQALSVYTRCLSHQNILLHVLFDIEYMLGRPEHIDSRYYRGFGSGRVRKLYNGMFQRIRACAEWLHLTTVVMPAVSYIEEFGNEWRAAFEEHMSGLHVDLVEHSPLAVPPTYQDIPHIPNALVVVKTHPDEPFHLDHTTASICACGLINPNVKFMSI